jgi:acetolactate synthase-1/2/3 large subunit
VPGPAFVECPIDLLYPKELVKGWYVGEAGKGGGDGIAKKAMRWYLERHADRLFAGAEAASPGPRVALAPSAPLGALVHAASLLLKRAERPVLLVGSQALARAGRADAVAAAVARLGVPTYLAGMARGLLGRGHPLQMRHKRGAALKEADLVILAGVPCDFRLGYGRSIGGKASVIAVNLSATELFKNRRPTLPVPGDPGAFLERLAAIGSGGGDARWAGWRQALRARDGERDAEIAALAAEAAPPVNPLAVVRAIEEAMADDSVVVADGGDFVASAAYVVRPRGPLRWLDPGVFGTLGVGAGFALAASLCRPGAETWLIYGDGAAGFSLVELDSFARHRLPVIAVVGNDACWTQIARDQVTYLKDDVGCPLARTDYDQVAEGYGAVGLRVTSEAELGPALARAKAAAREGRPALVNVHIGQTKFREGSISM